MWPDLAPSTDSLEKPTESQWETLRATKAISALTGAFAGDLLAPEIWNKQLTNSEVQTLNSCLSNVSPLRPLTWSVSGGPNITETIMNKTEPCRKRQFDHLLLPQRMTYRDNHDLCQKMNMNMIRPRTGGDYDRLYDDVTTNAACDGGGGSGRVLWLESKYSDRCLALTTSGQESTSCVSKLCGGCQIPRPHRYMLILRGLCPLPDADLAFVATSVKGRLFSRLD